MPKGNGTEPPDGGLRDNGLTWAVGALRFVERRLEMNVTLASLPFLAAKRVSSDRGDRASMPKGNGTEPPDGGLRDNGLTWAVGALRFIERRLETNVALASLPCLAAKRVSSDRGDRASMPKGNGTEPPDGGLRR